MGKLLVSSLLLASLAAAQAPRELDAGTWVRKSFTVVPGAVGDCPDQEVFQKRAERVYKVHMVPPFLRDELMHKARNRARASAAACEEMRQNLSNSLRGEWSGLLSMERFDANPMPVEKLRAVSEAFGARGSAGLEAVLKQELGDTLRAQLAATALSRSAHLRADYQKNSLVNDKLKTEDITESELALVRGSAHVLVIRARGLDIELNDKKGGWHGTGLLEMEMWSFDPVDKTFKQVLTDRSSPSDDGSPSGLGMGMAASAGSFRSNILNLQSFRFTSQTISLDGSWLLPASRFQSNTKADLKVHRRFLYTENQVGKNGAEKLETIGYGYIDRVGKDSTVRIRHIGGQSPYVGMTLEEIPGTWWATFGYAYSNTEVSPSRPGTDEYGERLVLRHLSPAPTLRLQIRGNAPGEGLFQYFGLDIAGSVGDAYGALEMLDVDSSVTHDTAVIYANRMPLSGLWAMEFSLNYGVRVPLRRLALTAGIQAGIRPTWLSFNPEERSVEVRDTTMLGKVSRPEPYWEEHDISRANSIDAWIGLIAGAQFSINAANGIGVEARWEPWRGRSDWEVTEGPTEDENSFSVPTNEGGLGRLQLTFQWIFR
ncbi:MAG: hypothetical protein RL318_1739 [Fibrobacterota bacterium]|jgi:hypothetical protein